MRARGVLPQSLGRSGITRAEWYRASEWYPGAPPRGRASVPRAEWYHAPRNRIAIVRPPSDWSPVGLGVTPFAEADHLFWWGVTISPCVRAETARLTVPGGSSTRGLVRHTPPEEVLTFVERRAGVRYSRNLKRGS